MDRELIEEEAYKRYPNKYDHSQMLHVTSDCLWNGFIEGAEWMQEQCQQTCSMETMPLERYSTEYIIAECEVRGLFIQEKNKLIEKACKWLKDSFEGGNYVQDWQIEEFKRAMKGE